MQGSPGGLRYLAVANVLKERIISGVYRPGERLPRQHDMAKANGVSFVTLKTALDLLERDGYLRRKAGEGTYAALPQERETVALIVDDDPSFSEFLAAALGTCGWKSVAAGSGLAALGKLRERPFDLILLDLVMPGMNGAETFREIRNISKDVEVVIVTGYPDSALMADALRVGPFAVISKPFSIEQLEIVLERAKRLSGSAKVADKRW